MARRRTKGRNVNGILLLNKPAGMTSNEALQAVKRLYFARKAGHTGSLDPLATGLLPICLGEATKVSGFLLDADKRYRVRCRLGERTTVEVERQPRRIRIHELELLAWEPPFLDIEVHCSKGTYVRTLAEDIARALGTEGHVHALRRTGVGPYDDSDLVTLDELEAASEQGREALDALLLPIESALMQWPDVHLTDDAAFYVRQGQPVLVPHAPTSGWVRMYRKDRDFLGMGQILDDGRVAPRRLMTASRGRQ